MGSCTTSVINIKAGGEATQGEERRAGAGPEEGGELAVVGSGTCILGPMPPLASRG